MNMILANKNMITVLHYAPGFRSGGIESRLLDWYRNINREEIKFVLVKLNDEDDTENMKEFMSLGGAWYNLPTLSISNYKIFIDGIKNIFDNEIIDIVHVHDVSSGFFILKEAKRRGVKCRILHSRTTSYLPNELTSLYACLTISITLSASSFIIASFILFFIASKLPDFAILPSHASLLFFVSVSDLL